MARGYMVDGSRSASASNIYNYYPSYWVEGEPRKGETLFGASESLNISGAAKFMVRALRCEGCGFLENYAV